MKLADSSCSAYHPNREFSLSTCRLNLTLLRLIPLQLVSSVHARTIHLVVDNEALQRAADV